eukprot:TRINITY_DN2653_c0_g1_i1.p1 TRINITY_DN2653_c0_g1~~TRINITY_DN2653_c0_g1_i1.p1  ORF type:complete len:316 (+),score=68.33 TRINITY_DN2653_c0_g1_i1:150-1097(+)
MAKWNLESFDFGGSIPVPAGHACAVRERRGSGSQYTLKVQRKDELVGTELLCRLVQEKNVLSDLQHRFVLNLSAVFQDAGHVYLLHDAVASDLCTVLRRAGRLPADVARFYHAELVVALQYLHSKDIVHRHVSPENMLLAEDGHMKLGDFSNSKRIAAADRTFTLCGLPEYLAPEIIQSKGHGRAVDWWAMGVLLYELLSGQPPWVSDDSPLRIYEMIVEGAVDMPGHFPSAAARYIEALLTVDHTKRLGTLTGGAADVRGHPFFAAVDWERVESGQYPPPIPVEPIRSFTAPECPGRVATVSLSDEDQALFKGF